MSTVIISAESYCHREEIAKAVADRLGYACVGPEVLAEASRRYDVPEEKLLETLESTSSFRDSFSSARTRNLAYLQAAFLGVLVKDDVVYHGWEGHLLIDGVSHILKVRLMADLEARARSKAEAEEIPVKKAREGLRKESEFVHHYARHVFGVDTADASLFELALDVTKTGQDRCVDVIADLVRDVRFQPITYSRNTLRDKELASRIRAALITEYPDVRVHARDGNVSIDAGALKKKKPDLLMALKQEMEGIEGVSYVEIG